MKLFASVILLSSSFARAEDSPFSFFLDKKEPAYKNSFDEKMCKQMAREKPSKCVTQPEQMEMICQKACADRIRYYTSDSIDDAEFYDLSANKWDGSKLSFSNFDGYILAIVNLPITCKKEDEAKIIADFHKLQNMVPSTVEFVVFPFEIDGYVKGDDCIDFEKEVSLGRKNIHVMKPVQLNGENTHPVYKFVKDAIDTMVIREDVGTVFFVSPEGTQVDKLEDKTIAKFKRYSNVNLKSWEL